MHIHRELVLSDASKLQDDDAVLIGVDELKVLDRGHGHPPVEVEHVGVYLLVPAGRLIDEVRQIA